MALTLVPALSRFVFRRYRPRRDDFSGKVKGAYGRSLQFALRHKALPLLVAASLLVVAVVGAAGMGISLLPSMTSRTVSLTVTVPEGTEKDDAFAVADQVMDAALSVEGVGTVGGRRTARSPRWSPRRPPTPGPRISTSHVLPEMDDGEPPWR